MITSILEILKNHGINLNQSVYYNESDQFLNFRISCKDLFSLIGVDKTNEPFKIIMICKKLIDQKKQQLEYIEISKKLNSIITKIKDLHSQEKINNQNGSIKSNLKELRLQKKILVIKKENLEQKYKMEVYQKVFNDLDASPNERLAIKFKNKSIINSFENIKDFIPELKSIQANLIDEMPLFTNKINELKKSIQEDKKIAIEGGPCLFGSNEMDIIIFHSDGTSKTFDFSVGNHGENLRNLEEISVEDYIMKHKNHIINIDFNILKKGITSQEYDSIHYLFEFGAALNANIVIPIPDFSYKKYFLNILRGLDSNLISKIINNFNPKLYEVSDMFINLINKIKQKDKYKNLEVCIVHDRDKKLLDLFYSQRQKEFTPHIIKGLTNNQNKMDSILDYTSMPALPFYIWGIKDIIQIDSFYETETYIKCSQIYNNIINIFALLYPERLSKDNKTTIFNTELKYKEYLTRMDT